MLIDKNAILCYNNKDVAGVIRRQPSTLWEERVFMRNQKPVGFRKSGYTPRVSVIALLMAIFSILLSIILAKAGKVHETYTERSFRVENGTLVEQEYKKETTRPLTKDEYQGIYAGVTLELQKMMNDKAFAEAPKTKLEVKTAEKTVVSEPAKEEVVVVKHFSESTYIKGAIMMHGEAGGIPSMTERSGPLWCACNRVDSDDPFFPDNLEAVIEQDWQFDGYTPGGEYTQEDYDLAVDVFERWYREKNGESALSVGRTLPSEYLFFTGDGVHNYFRKTQTGTIYVWGSQLPGPYKN